jgi:hypothetical protein
MRSSRRGSMGGSMQGSMQGRMRGSVRGSMRGSSEIDWECDMKSIAKCKIGDKQETPFPVCLWRLRGFVGIVCMQNRCLFDI